MDLFGNQSATQSQLDFPVSLTERYKPTALAEFVGLPKPKAICAKLAERPFDSAWLFLGPSGTGKTSMGMALAALIPAELHHIPAQNCTLADLERVYSTCHRVPTYGKRFHLVLVDEADGMTDAAQKSLLSRLDGSAPCPTTIWIFTANDTARLEARFLSRLKTVEFSSYGISQDAAKLLERIWIENAPSTAKQPNFARIVKDANNNVREALQSLELELMLA